MPMRRLASWWVFAKPALGRLKGAVVVVVFAGPARPRAGGAGMGAVLSSLRFTGTLRVWSRPGVRCSLGTGDSTCGLKA